MGDVQPGNLQPRVQLEQLSVERGRDDGTWSICWAVHNCSTRPLRILSVRLPHGQFKSGEQPFEPAIELEQNEESEFQTLVRCDEAPGPVTENAFVIFYVMWLEEPWRIFVRIRVIVDPEGKPHATTELVTTQKAGFSQQDLP